MEKKVENEKWRPILCIRVIQKEKKIFVFRNSEYYYSIIYYFLIITICMKNRFCFQLHDFTKLRVAYKNCYNWSSPI